MPVRRKKDKHRSIEGLDNWYFVFLGGHDYFEELPPLGITTDAYGRPTREESEVAWRRLGEAFLELPRHADLGPPWALLEFGDPSSRRTRRR